MVGFEVVLEAVVDVVVVPVEEALLVLVLMVDVEVVVEEVEEVDDEVEEVLEAVLLVFEVVDVVEVDVVDCVEDDVVVEVEVDVLVDVDGVDVLVVELDELELENPFGWITDTLPPWALSFDPELAT